MGDTASILRLREDHERLIAVVQPGTDRPPLDAALVREQLAVQGLSALYVDENALARLLTAYAQSPDRIELCYQHLAPNSQIVSCTEMVKQP